MRPEDGGGGANVPDSRFRGDSRRGVHKHNTQNGYIWALVAECGVVCEIQDSRSNEAVQKLLGTFGPETPP